MILAVAAVGAALFIRRGWWRLPPAPDRPTIPILEGSALLLSMVLLGQLGAGAASLLWPWVRPDPAMPPPPSDVELAAQCTLRAAAYAAQLLAMAAFFWLTATRRQDAAQIFSLKRALALGLGATLLWIPEVQTVSFVAAAIASAAGADVSDPLAHQTLRLLDEVGVNGWFIATIALAILVAPVMEEIIYRGLLQRLMMTAGLPRWPAVFAASIVFVLMHVGAVEPYALAGLFVLSVGLGWAYERSGRLIAPILMHALFNAVNLALAMLMMSTPA